MRVLSIGVLLLIWSSVVGQVRKNIEVEGFVNPWVGGLNLPQFSEADFNNDGLMDLYMFDKAGEVSIVYIQEKKAGVSSYRFAPEYAAELPKELSNWVMLRDYDKDGAMDIFASSSGIEKADGIIIYKGYFQNNILKFNRVQLNQGDSNLLYILVGAKYTQLYVSKEDYPSIDDIDGDGDLDVVTFSAGGSNVEWYKNTSVETGNKLNALNFVLEDPCWGKFYESGTNETIKLSTNKDLCVHGLTDGTGEERNQLHVGSTLVTFDADGDGDKEVLIGDISFYSLNLLTNGGTKTEAWMTNQDKFFPSYDVSANIVTFPVAFYLDADFDGKKDILAVPNLINSTEDYNNVYFYKNTTDNTNPRFKYIDNTQFSKDMLDFGSMAKVAVADINADGLKDLLVGASYYIKSQAERDSRLIYLKNIGTPNVPKFKIENNNFLNMSQYTTLTNYSPTFGDLDGDGDEDLYIGNNIGHLVYFENTAGIGKPMQFNPQISIFNNNSKTELFDVGEDSTPFIIDLNEDGLLDFVVGEATGNINFYPNTGTKTKPIFLSSNAKSNFGFIYQANVNRSSPFIFKNGNHFELITGSGGKGNFRHYKFTSQQLKDTFELLNSNFMSIKEGGVTNLVLTDIDNDKKLDAFVGNFRGGLAVFGTDISVFSQDLGVDNQDDIRVFPNPANEYITIQTERETELIVSDILGKVVLQNILSSGENTISTDHFTNGTYIFQFKNNNKKLTIKKVVICRK